MPNKFYTETPEGLRTYSNGIQEYLGMRNMPRGMDLDVTPKKISDLENTLKAIEEYQRRSILQEFYSAKIHKLADPNLDLEEIIRSIKRQTLDNTLNNAMFNHADQMNNFNLQQRKDLGIDPQKHPLPTTSRREWWM